MPDTPGKLTNHEVEERFLKAALKVIWAREHAVAHRDDPDAQEALRRAEAEMSVAMAEWARRQGSAR